jgi:murein DD-endopeptidase MepM/ murein hydrolase activator NlpD
MGDRKRDLARPARPEAASRASARRAAAVALACGLALAGCGTKEPPRPPPATAPAPRASAPVQRVHVVRRGENLYRIGLRYGVPASAIAKANRLADPTKLAIGQRLTIPGTGATPTAVVPSTRGEWTRRDPRGRGGEPSLVWPVSGKVSSGFGMRRGAHHDGVDIPMPRGSPVRAAEAGRVIHSGGGLSGYGNTIILRHAGRLSTVYAHNKRNLVRVGDFVERGQIIAEVGRTGRASTHHLHFEVRRDGRAIDPLDYLPCSTLIASAC